MAETTTTKPKSGTDLSGIASALKSVVDDLTEAIKETSPTSPEGTYLNSALADVESAKRRVDSAIPPKPEAS